MHLHFLGVLTVVAGCAGGDPATPSDSGPDTGLAITGTWTDDFGTTHAITEVRWTQTWEGLDPLTFDVAAWDDTHLVAQNGADADYFAGQWSRFDWVFDDAGELYYCQSAYDAADQAGAEAAPPGDATDLDAGCGGFLWTHLLP